MDHLIEVIVVLEMIQCTLVLLGNTNHVLSEKQKDRARNEGQLILN